MSTFQPSVSVILPVYNAERSVAAAIESVIRQSYADFELIVINDGSTDNSSKILAAYKDSRIRIIERPHNVGLVTALNDALAEARGVLVARQDADDISLPERLALQREVLDTDPNVGAVGTSLELITNGTASGKIWNYPNNTVEANWQSLFKTPVAHSAVMYRRRLVLEVGGYSENFKFAEDYDLWSRLLKVSGIKSIPKPLVRYSVDSGGVSRSKFSEQRAVHCRIASKNMSDLLGRVVPADVAHTLAILIDDPTANISYPQFIMAAETCSELYNTFVEKFYMRGICDQVSAHFCSMLMRMVRMLPYRMRPRAVIKSRQLSPPGALSTNAMVRAILRP